MRWSLAESRPLRSLALGCRRCGSLLSMASRFTELVVDASDPGSLASFWMSVLEWELAGTDDDGVVIVEPSGRLPTVMFARVPGREDHEEPTPY